MEKSPVLVTELLKDGGADRDRTCDTHNALVVLYQLSYDPIQSDGHFRHFPLFVKTFCGIFYRAGALGNQFPAGAAAARAEGGS